MNRAAAAAGIVLGAVLLASCSTSKQADDGRFCPRAGIVGDLADLVRYKGSGRDLTDVSYSAQITGVHGSCEATKSGVDVDTTVTIVASRGPAYAGEAPELDYFVAVIAPDKTILAKQVFHTRIDFRNGALRAGSAETISEKVPIPDKKLAPSEYGILVGFQLTPEQIKANRARRGM